MTTLESSADSEVQVWPSYTDVAFTLVFILLTYVFAQAVVAGQSSAASQIIRQRQAALGAEIMDALPPSLRQFVTLRDDGNLLKVAFADRVLFDRGSADLRTEGQHLLKTVGGVLQRNVQTFTQVQVEGHTDDRPISTAKFHSNWELSSARATSVVRLLQDGASMEPVKLSATGYSEYHPIDGTPSEDAKARNRRIEMVIVYSLHDAARSGK